MDWIGMGEKIGKMVKKNRYILLILAVGISFMLLSGKQKPQETALPSVISDATPSVSQQLEEILAQIHGAGRVRLLLTLSSGEETVYQTDENRSDGQDSGSIRTETVMVTDSNRVQTGLISRVDPPSYLGAVVVCQGADQPSVRLAVVEAVSNATGLSTDRITVLKMK